MKTGLSYNQHSKFFACFQFRWSWRGKDYPESSQAPWASLLASMSNQGADHLRQTAPRTSTFPRQS